MRQVEPAARRAPLPPALARAMQRLREPDAPPPAALVAELEGLAGATPDALVELVVSERVSFGSDEPERALERVQRALLLELVARLPLPAVLAALDRIAGDCEPGAHVSTTIELLGARGSAGDLGTLVERAGRALNVPAAARRDRALRAAVAAILVRDPSAHEVLLARWTRFPVALLEPIVLAVGDAGSPAGHELLADVVRMRSKATPIAVAQIGRIGPAPSADLNRELCGVLRQLLDPSEPERCRAATAALARFEDADALPRWIELLEGDERSLREDAVWALRRVSGRDFPASPALWRSWLAGEEAWFARRLGPALAALEGSDPGAAAAAIRELSQRRIHRGEVARLIGRALGHRDPTVRALACRSMGALGRVEAAEELRIARADPVAAVGRAAAEALFQLTGESWEEPPEGAPGAAPAVVPAHR